MPRLQPTLSLLLGLVAAASLVYAWQLHGRLVDTEADRAASALESTQLRARLNRVQKTVTPLPPLPGPPTMASAGSPTGGPAGAEDFAAARGPGRASSFAALRDTPEFQRLMAIQNRAALDGRYAALFRKLALNPADLDRLKTLLAERQSIASDVMGAMRAQGSNPREARDQFELLLAKYEADSDAAIQAALGSSRFAEYKQYEQTMPARSVVGQLEQRLSYSSSPLAANQTEQLVNLLAAANPSAAGNIPVVRGGPMAGSRIQLTDVVVAQSQAILSAAQIDALRQIQQEQAAREQMRQQFRARAGNGAPSGP